MELSQLHSKFMEIKLAAKLQKIKKGAGLIVQSVLFNKNKFNSKSAKAWLKKHGFKSSKIDITEDYLRFRQKNPKQFKVFRTINFGKGIKAIVAGNTSKFVASMTIQNMSKFSADYDIKSDLDIPIPLTVDIKILCDGQNRDGYLKPSDLEESLDGWSNIPIVDIPHSKDKHNETAHSMSDRKGYTTGNPRIEYQDGKKWVYVKAKIHNRDIAYQMYLKEKSGQPFEVSAEYVYSKYIMNGKTYQVNIRPRLINLVDEGHIEGNSIKILDN